MIYSIVSSGIGLRSSDSWTRVEHRQAYILVISLEWPIIATALVNLQLVRRYLIRHKVEPYGLCMTPCGTWTPMRVILSDRKKHPLVCTWTSAHKGGAKGDDSDYAIPPGDPKIESRSLPVFADFRGDTLLQSDEICHGPGGRYGEKEFGLA
jgi:hypothetical protein